MWLNWDFIVTPAAVQLKAFAYLISLSGSASLWQLDMNAHYFSGASI